MNKCSAGYCFAIVGLIAMSAKGVTIGAVEGRDGFDLTISGIVGKSSVIMAFGSRDGGDDPQSWESLAQVRAVSASDAVLTVPYPDGWGDTVRCAKFFVAEGALLNYDCLLDSLTSKNDNGYVNTKLTLTGANWVEMTVTAPTPLDAGVWAFWCNRAASLSAGWSQSYSCYRIGSTGAFRLDVGDSVGSGVVKTISAGERFTVLAKPQDALYVGDPAKGMTKTSVPSVTVGDDYEAGGALFLFNAYSHYQPGNMVMAANHLPCACHSVRIYSNAGATIEHEFIPALRNNALGLYDDVTKAFVEVSDKANFGLGDQTVRPVSLPSFSPQCASEVFGPAGLAIIFR